MSENIKLATWIVLCPFISLLLIGAITRSYKKLSALVAILAISISTILATILYFKNLYGLTPQVHYFEWLITDYFSLKFGILVDSLSIGMIMVVCIVSLLVHIYSWGYMEGEAGLSRYYAWLSLFSWAMLVFVVSPTLLQAFFGWELVGAASFLLIGFWYYKPEAAQAARKAFVMTRFGDFGFFVGLLILLVVVGNVDFHVLNKLGTNMGVSPKLITMTALFIFMGIMGKSAQFPLHAWLPDAMEGPTPVSALIHAATMVAAGIYLIARAFGFFSASPFAMEFIAAVGILTSFVAATIALVQNDVKKIMAYSTISQLGLMVAALGAGGYKAGVFHLFSHAFFKALLFLCAGSLIHHFHTNDMWEMAEKGGVRKMKITITTLIIGSLALAGCPPFAGFFSKDAILVAFEMNGKHTFMYITLLISFLTTYYSFRMIFVLLSPEKEHSHSHGHEGDHHGHGHDSPANMTIPLIILAVFSVLFGFVDTPLMNGYFDKFLLNKHEVEHLHWSVMIKSFVVFLAGISFAYVQFAGKTGYREGFAEKIGWLKALLVNKYYVDDFYFILVRGLVYPFASILNWIDRKVINDTGVNGSGNIVIFSGRFISSLMNGLLQRYLGTSLVILFILVFLWQLI
ncbi:MAG: NADH-quinone oxidoreductase subunit L [Proteobacteria bacterium]|nr:NADH-quinone oxidoreductase subunit L [Pseudomonadota bacterium]